LKIYLPVSWLLTDEHPMAAQGTLVLIDLDTWKIYYPGDRIEGVSAKQLVSLAVETRGENYLLPEEIQFISRFKEEDHESESFRVGHIGNKIKFAYEDIIDFLRRR
jgi:hypothetical protein